MLSVPPLTLASTKDASPPSTTTSTFEAVPSARLTSTSPSTSSAEKSDGVAPSGSRVVMSPVSCEHPPRLRRLEDEPEARCARRLTESSPSESAETAHFAPAQSAETAAVGTASSRSVSTQAAILAHQRGLNASGASG